METSSFLHSGDLRGLHDLYVKTVFLQHTARDGPCVALAGQETFCKVSQFAGSLRKNGTFNHFSGEPACTLAQHNSVFTRQTDLRRNPYTILLVNVLLLE